MKKVLLILTAFSTLFLVANCAPKKQTITVIGNASYILAIQQLVDAGLYKGSAEIDLQLVPENEIDPKIRLEMITGAKTFDIAITEAGSARQYGGMGLLHPLPSHPEEYNDFFEGNRNQYAIGSTIYGYPFLADNGIFYYNEVLLKEAGFAGPPKNWDEFFKMAIHATKDTNGRRADEPGFDGSKVATYGFSYKGGPKAANPWELTWFLYGNGWHYIEKDYAKGTYEVTCNRPEIVNVISKIVELKNKYHAIPEGFANFDYQENREMLAQGRVAMIFDWPGTYGRVLRKSPQGPNIRSTNLPKGLINDSGPIGGWSINVFKDSKNIEEALKVAQAWSSKEGAYIFAKANGSTPTRQSAMDRLTAEYLASDQEIGRIYETVGKALLTGQEQDLAQTAGASKDVVMKAAEVLSAIYAGQKQPQQGMDELKVYIEEALQKINYMK